MKKLLSVGICAVALCSSFAFAQYWGGGSTYSPSAGYSTFALTRDVCTNLDRSPSIYDGSCGDVAGSQLLVTGPNGNLVKKIKRRRISFTRLLRQVPVLNNLFQ